jgi:phage shock protein PspC (stress-responsive transcriptional regulator)
MNRRIPFALDSHDKKLLGVCAGLGRSFGVDPLFVRVAFVAVPLLTFVTVWQAILAYLICGAIGAAAKGRRSRIDRRSDYERMGDPARRSSVHDVLTKLDSTDRRLMAIDHHLNSSSSDALAREIEALRREDKKTEEEAK